MVCGGGGAFTGKSSKVQEILTLFNTEGRNLIPVFRHTAQSAHDKAHFKISFLLHSKNGCILASPTCTFLFVQLKWL